MSFSSAIYKPQLFLSSYNAIIIIVWFFSLWESLCGRDHNEKNVLWLTFL